ncbi:MAG TPA: gliding motility-associated C-terminal domain-containing protein, partial [Flavobacterium sp.]|nr:gliding motility-associated C-terminal domain-containing protein [Flavobacterium sp.]
EPQLTANCDNLPEIPQLIFIDNCSTVGTATYSEEIINETADGYTIVREWQVADSCGNNSVFTQEVDVTIVNSETNIPKTACNEDITVVDLNTYLPDGTPTGGTWVDVDTTGALSGSNFAQFGLAVGTYTYQYQIDDPVCPRVINIVMTVNTNCIVLPCTDIEVHNAFTPNGDGINEHFQIDGINETECYPTNTVEIYNRWGVLVYETRQYDNADRSFKGYSEGRVTVNKNDQLPTGTYFYLLQYTTSEGTVVKKDGYLYLSR